MIDTDNTNMYSHLQIKLFEPGGEYNRLWFAMQDDVELTDVSRSFQLQHIIYRNNKNILILAGISDQKGFGGDKLNEYLC